MIEFEVGNRVRVKADKTIWTVEYVGYFMDDIMLLKVVGSDGKIGTYIDDDLELISDD